MQLTRRDALAALSGAGIVIGSGAAALSRQAVDTDGTADGRLSLDDTLEALVATAEIVYPSDVEGVREFVETYSLGRIQERPEYCGGVREAVGTLEEFATLWYDDRYSDLEPRERDVFLRELGVDTADEDPNGTDAERVRYYIVNELLFALYSSPTGGELVGIENPQGHPGGIDSYHRGPR